MRSARPLILDFDDSTGVVDNAMRIDLRSWQDRIRFGCTLSTFNTLREHLAARWPEQHGTVLMGSGDYHHVSWLLIERIKMREPFDVVVLDNHPDNMLFPFGVHCGSWVRKVALLPQVRHVHVLGICSQDISSAAAWQNYKQPLEAGKLSYWCCGVDVSWAVSKGLAGAFHRFEDPSVLVRSFCAQLQSQQVYLSIDKDVFAPEVVRTNWDQGRMSLEDARVLIDTLSGRLIGSDITGEVSLFHYQSWWKRLLSALDAQPAIPAAQITDWQVSQQSLNRSLLALIAQASV